MSTPQENFLEAVRRRQRATLGVEGSEVEENEPSDFLAQVIERTGNVRGREAGGFERKFADVGVIRAFGSGIKEGLLDPLTVFGREGEELRLDETSEKVASAVGFMVGAGIGFVPFAAGTSFALKGLGLAKNIPRTIKAADGITDVANPLWDLVRNTIAGATQFGLGSEEVEDVPKNVIGGIVFGGAVEGVFLARALRGRKGKIGSGSLVDNGSPSSDVPVDPVTIAKEETLFPSGDKTASRISTDVNNLVVDEVSYDRALIALAGDNVDTIRLPGLSVDEAVDLAKHANELYPEAQVLTRSVKGGTERELLVYNPIDPNDALTPKQAAQWKATGYAEGQEVLYGSPAKSYMATGVDVAEGRVQLRDPHNPGRTFSVKQLETTRPLTTRFYNKSNIREQNIRAAITSTENEIGIVIPSATVGERANLSAKRGIVDVSEYEVVESLGEFTKKHAKVLQEIEAPSPDEALAILGRNLGLKGLVIKEGGITKAVRVFDQESVSFIKAPPRPAKVPPVERLTRNLEEASELRVSSKGGKEFVIERQGNNWLIRGIRPGGLVDRRGRSLSAGSGLPNTDTESIFARRLEDIQVAAGQQKGFSSLDEALDRIPEAKVIDKTFPDTPETRLGEVPQVGLTLTNAVVSTDTATGKTILHSFEPSWKTSIGSALRRQGVPEKEIQQHLDLYAAQIQRDLEGLMSPEALAAKKASEIQFGGCP